MVKNIKKLLKWLKMKKRLNNKKEQYKGEYR